MIVTKQPLSTFLGIC